MCYSSPISSFENGLTCLLICFSYVMLQNLMQIEAIFETIGLKCYAILKKLYVFFYNGISPLFWISYLLCIPITLVINSIPTFCVKFLKALRLNLNIYSNLNFDLAPLCPLSLCKSHETKIKYQTGTISGTNFIRLVYLPIKNCYT